MDPPIRATRPPPSRRALFQTSTSTRRNHPSTSVVRPDTATTVFPPAMCDELVERDEKGQFKVNAPSTMYKHLAMGANREAEEEIEQENQIIDLYGKQDAHWDPAAVEEEIKGAVKSSLRRKVASLQEDRWMFEGGAEKR
ncbi:hypothetical protein BDU57DRAFT_518438 [Ampelomyces quisqualis]|uniref:Uncharacterized protein n=1 Tax=Ampelomyces quisqualis TaxID=50730 RepID=A0A6A5QIA4_AMPQU|nr:hypothetical protein BDU57DRAFT_518438 [Ampelomyces quisqualis]